MNTRVLWWSAAAFATILLMWKREAIVSTVRGLRNNNPGNVREPRGDATVWIGERATDDDPAFEEFTEMRYGIRAALIVFRNYQRLYGLNTISQLISRWAPPTENDTAAYIESVRKRTGIAATSPINLRDPHVAYNFLRAVFRHENGVSAEAISESTIREGIRLAA